MSEEFEARRGREFVVKASENSDYVFKSMCLQLCSTASSLPVNQGAAHMVYRWGTLLFLLFLYIRSPSLTQNQTDLLSCRMTNWLTLWLDDTPVDLRTDSLQRCERCPLKRLSGCVLCFMATPDGSGRYTGTREQEALSVSTLPASKTVGCLWWEAALCLQWNLRAFSSNTNLHLRDYPLCISN